MRRFMLIVLTNLMCCVCTGQIKEFCTHDRRSSTVTFEAGSLIRDDEIEISFSRSIGRKWSVSFSSSVTLDKKKKDEARSDHESSLMADESTQEPRKSDGRFRNVIFASFWTKETYEGPFISIGVGHDNGMKPDIIISPGYMFTICRRMKGSIGYRADMIGLLRHDDRSGCHPTIGLSFSL